MSAAALVGPDAKDECRTVGRQESWLVWGCKQSSGCGASGATPIGCRGWARLYAFTLAASAVLYAFTLAASALFRLMHCETTSSLACAYASLEEIGAVINIPIKVRGMIRKT